MKQRVIIFLTVILVSILGSQGQEKLTNSEYRAYAKCEASNSGFSDKLVWTPWVDSRAMIELKDCVLTVADLRYVINKVNYTTVVNGRKCTGMIATCEQDGLSYTIILSEYDKKKIYQLKINTRIKQTGSAYMMRIKK